MTKTHTSAFAYKLGGSIVFFVLCFAVSLLFGAADTTYPDLWHAIAGRDMGDKALMLREIRIPREVGAILVGSAFAVSGAVMQGVTRNPLADPGLLGLSSGAYLALAVGIAFIPGLNYFGIMTACFIGAAFGAALVITLGSMRRGSLSPIRLVLAGAAVSAFLYAIADGLGLLFKISKDVSMWTAGGLVGTTWGQLQAIAPVILVALIVTLFMSNQVTLLSLSDEVATGLGQKLVQIKAIMFVLIVLLTGASVALVGNMAFVGLMIPHIVRRFVGTDYRYILPFSVFAGASFMLLADTIGRTLNSPYETPVVAVVAMLGLPFFLFVVRKGGKALS
ncbi:FecCD family ABC transporter permease [Cohnella phaseoli]|uniref:Iron complex transport system permease protein n=1 Tax=Cohnella phaseoli TaxID=456490 RepID=A0A3D9I656_9BACL|nr:iron ABC transporter permease [Cohnella phaseoli]RED57019.1 iron complex transport system permease protein [Cohnella phaseoli]